MKSLPRFLAHGGRTETVVKTAGRVDRNDRADVEILVRAEKDPIHRQDPSGDLQNGILDAADDQIHRPTAPQAIELAPEDAQKEHPDVAANVARVCHSAHAERVGVGDLVLIRHEAVQDLRYAVVQQCFGGHDDEEILAGDRRLFLQELLHAHGIRGRQNGGENEGRPRGIFRELEPREKPVHK